MHGVFSTKYVTAILLRTAFHDPSFMKNACVVLCLRTSVQPNSVRLGRNQSADPQRGIIHLRGDALCFSKNLHDIE